MNETELDLLVRLYSELQDCPFPEQAERRKAFSSASKAFAAKKNLEHWRVTAFAVREWNKRCQSEDRKKGIPHTSVSIDLTLPEADSP